jgi:hypothetical protein
MALSFAESRQRFVLGRQSCILWLGDLQAAGYVDRILKGEKLDAMDYCKHSSRPEIFPARRR